MSQCLHGGSNTVSGLYILLVPLFLLGACSGGGSGRQLSFQVGERAQVGPLVYTVTDVEWHNHLGAGMQVQVPDNKFLIVRLSITNGGGKPVAIPLLFLEAENGQRIPELQEVQGMPEWMGLLREIDPAETLQGRIIFDAPPRNLRLRITDGALEEDERTSYIDIQYRLGSAPAVPSGGF